MIATDKSRRLRCLRRRQLRRAEPASPRIDRNLHLALRTLLSRRIGRRRILARARDQGVDRSHHEEIYRRRDQQEGNQRVDEVAKLEYRGTHREVDRREVRFADKGGDQGRQQIRREGGAYRTKRSANDDADCEIHYVSAKNELLESAQHERGLPLREN